MADSDIPEDGNDDEILAAYHALQDRGKSDRERASEEIRAGLEEVVSQVSQGKRLPIHSPDYAEIAHDLGFDGLREALDRRHREVTRKAIGRRLSRRKGKKRQTEEQLRQYILPRLEEGILGRVLTNPKTEIDTPTGRVDILATDKREESVLVELKGEDWEAANSAKHYELIGQVSTYFNELDEKASEGHAVIVVPEFPQRVYNGLRGRIQAGRISAFTFTVEGEEYRFSPVDFEPLEEQLTAASEHAFEKRSGWVASMEREAEQEESPPDSVAISELIPRGAARKRRKRKPMAVSEPEAAAAEGDDEFKQRLEKWEGAEVTEFVYGALRVPFGDEEFIKLVRHYITTLSVIGLPREIDIERCDGLLTQIMRENPSAVEVNEWYRSFTDFFTVNTKEIEEYRETLQDITKNALSFIRDFFRQIEDISNGANLMDRINGIIGRHKKAPRNVRTFNEVLETAIERLTQKLKTTGLSDEENLIFGDVVAWNYGRGEFIHKFSWYNIRNAALRAALLWRVDPELTVCYAENINWMGKDSSFDNDHLVDFIRYKEILGKIRIAEPTAEMEEMEGRVRIVLSGMDYTQKAEDETFEECLEKWQSAEVDRGAYKHLKRMGRSGASKSLAKAKKEYEAAMIRSGLIPGMVTMANFSELVISRLPQKHSARRHLTRMNSPLFDLEECAKQDADYLERIDRSSQEFSAALERFWEQPADESSIAGLENALRGITDICHNGCQVRRHFISSLDSSISVIERSGGLQSQRFRDMAKTARHEQNETLRKLNLEVAWNVLGRYRALLQVDKELAVRYVRSQAALLEIDTGMDMKALERGEAFYGEIFAKIRLKEEPAPAKRPTYRAPEMPKPEPKPLPEPSIDPRAYADDVYSAIIRTKREDTIPEAIQFSALELADHIAESGALTPGQKMELKEQLAHFRGKDPLNKPMYDRRPDEMQFGEFARLVTEAVDKGTVPDVHKIFSQTIR